MLLEGLFFEIGVIIIFAALLSLLVYRLRQPLIIAYILTGIIVGPSVFAIAKSGELFEVMSQIGVAFLLFTVGLGLNWRNVKDVGGIALATGVGQVIFTSVFGFAFAQALGYSVTTSLYLGVAFAFSSTIVIVKLLMDKEEIDMLYGRISIGFLLVQDFIAMFILLALGSLGTGAAIPEILLGTILKGILIVPLLWFISTKVVPVLVQYAAQSQELLFVFAVAWCFLIAGGLVAAGFGVELGALIAGVTLSGTYYEREINARIRPLRDFFLIIFFIVLGTHLGLESFVSALGPIVLFSVFILIGNPIIVMFIMRALGYHPRTGFLAGTTVAQISEFSFIVIAAGISIGHLESDILVLATAVALVTIAASSYLIEWNQWVYERLQPMLRWLEPKHLKTTIKGTKRPAPKIVLFGFEQTGRRLLESLRKLEKNYTIVDFDPMVVRELAEVGEPVMYGDAGDDNFLAEVQAEKAKLIVSTIPDLTISLELLRYLKNKGFKGTAVVSVHNEHDAMKCYEAGATYVSIPSVLSGERLREFLNKRKTKKSEWKSLAVDEKALFIEANLP